MAIFGNNDANYVVVGGTAAGTQIIKAFGTAPSSSPGHLYSVYVGVASTGSVSYYDGNGTSGTFIATVSNNGTKVPDLFPFMCRVTNGLVAIYSAGTTSQTVMWD